MTGGGEAETRAQSSCRERSNADGTDRLTSGGRGHCSPGLQILLLCVSFWKLCIRPWPERRP